MPHLASIKEKFSPAQISWIRFIARSGVALAIAADEVEIALGILFLAILLSRTERIGNKLDMVMGAAGENMIFFALALSGYAEVKTAALAGFAVVLSRVIREKSGFDPELRSALLFLGYFVSFEFALQAIFFANMAVFAVGTVIADFKMQKTNDGI